MMATDWHNLVTMTLKSSKYQSCSIIIIIIIIPMKDFVHGSQFQRGLVNYTRNIVMYKCVHKHRCTFCSFNLIVRWKRSGEGPTAWHASKLIEWMPITTPTSKIRAVSKTFVMKNSNYTLAVLAIDPKTTSTAVAFLTANRTEQLDLVYKATAIKIFFLLTNFC